ncbi:DUF4160 domain-containing protein [Thiolapillus sp.]|uniref:DUF4160 domain-containing protein n=1 Tax=Thiolapillus sp. TaxID=2017437 RepID=UPI003AF8C34F
MKRAKLSSETGEVIEGLLPLRVLGLVQEWRERHKNELSEDWQLARERKALNKIALYMTKKLSSTQRQIITNWVWKAWSQY